MNKKLLLSLLSLLSVSMVIGLLVGINKNNIPSLKTIVNADDNKTLTINNFGNDSTFTASTSNGNLITFTTSNAVVNGFLGNIFFR